MWSCLYAVLYCTQSLSFLVQIERLERARHSRAENGEGSQHLARSSLSITKRKELKWTVYSPMYSHAPISLPFPPNFCPFLNVPFSPCSLIVWLILLYFSSFVLFRCLPSLVLPRHSSQQQTISPYCALHFPPFSLRFRIRSGVGLGRGKKLRRGRGGRRLDMGRRSLILPYPSEAFPWPSPTTLSCSPSPPTLMCPLLLAQVQRRQVLTHQSFILSGNDARNNSRGTGAEGGGGGGDQGERLCCTLPLARGQAGIGRDQWHKPWPHPGVVLWAYFTGPWSGTWYHWPTYASKFGKGDSCYSHESS